MHSLTLLKFMLGILTAIIASSSALTCYKSDKTNQTCEAGEQCSLVSWVFVVNKANSYSKTRGCSSTCEPGNTQNVDAYGTTIISTTTCCESDHCNDKGVTGSHLCYTCASSIHGTYGCKAEGLNTADPLVGVTTCTGPCNKVTESASTFSARGCVDVCVPGKYGTWETNCCSGDRCNHAVKFGNRKSFILFMVAITLIVFSLLLV